MTNEAKIKSLPEIPGLPDREPDQVIALPEKMVKKITVLRNELSQLQIQAEKINTEMQGRNSRLEGYLESVIMVNNVDDLNIILLSEDNSSLRIFFRETQPAGNIHK